MSYCSLEDLKKAKPEIELVFFTDDENTGELDEDIIDEKISESDTRIDSYVGGRYSLPVEVIPKILKDIAVDLTIYFLWKRKNNDAPEVVVKAYDDAMKQLENIRQGKLFIPELDVADEPRGDVRINKTPEDRIFNKDLFSKL